MGFEVLSHCLTSLQSFDLKQLLHVDIICFCHQLTHPLMEVQVLFGSIAVQFYLVGEDIKTRAACVFYVIELREKIRVGLLSLKVGHDLVHHLCLPPILLLGPVEESIDRYQVHV